ncbi:MAG: ZIP family metal transporter [Bacteroidetes Order II. Incertae sedis bacterium]|nr:ZIP family metal transporter [Bacteroidetes Order II. bacterium]
MMTFLPVFLTGMAAFAANWLGIWLVSRRGAWAKRFEHDLISVAAGLVVGIAFLHFGPELAHHAPEQFAWMLVPFLSLYVLEHHFAPHFHHGHSHDDCENHHKQVGLMTAIGFGVHSVFDGLAIGAGFAYDWQIGLMAALAILVHEIPEGIATYAILRYSGHSEQAAFRKALLVAAITPVMAVLSFMILPAERHDVLGWAMALATGSLFYIGAADLLPEAAHKPGWRPTLLILAGLGIAYGLTVFGHHHG